MGGGAPLNKTKARKLFVNIRLSLYPGIGQSFSLVLRVCYLTNPRYQPPVIIVKILKTCGRGLPTPATPS